MVLEYLIKSCTGHPTTPKGGSKEYRNGPWYKPIYGRAQGDRMGKRRAYGHGSYAGKKMRFTTIEQKWSHFKKWYDNALKNTQIANPALSRRALMRAGSSRCVPWCVQLLAARSAHPSAGQKWRRRRRSSGSPAADPRTLSHRIRLPRPGLFL